MNHHISDAFADYDDNFSSFDEYYSQFKLAIKANFSRSINH